MGAVFYDDMKTLVVDDDRVTVKLLEQYIDKIDFLEPLPSCNDAISASKVLFEEKVDLLFLDVEMPELTGIELLKSLDIKPLVILISSHSKYAVDAFEVQVTDYLLKPITFSRFLKSVDKCKESYNVKTQIVNQSKSLFVKDGGVYINIPFDKIHWIEALGDYVNIHTPNKRYTILSTMKDLEFKLPPAVFVRVHRSFIVNLEKIDNLGGFNMLIDEKIIPIGKSYKKPLMDKLNVI